VVTVVSYLGWTSLHKFNSGAKAPRLVGAPLGASARMCVLLLCTGQFLLSCRPGATVWSSHTMLLICFSHISPLSSTMSTDPHSVNGAIAVRKSRRLSSSAAHDAKADESEHLVLPAGSELVANAFVVFRWRDHHCILQMNLSAHCWGRRRSGAIEHVLDKYCRSESSQLHRISTNSVTEAEWSWLKQILLVVLRLYDDKETGEMVGRIHWLNIIDCRLAYDMLRRECFYYHRHLYPAGSALGSHLKRCGIEVEDWYYSMTHSEATASAAAADAVDEEPLTPPPLQRPQEVNSGSSASGSSSASPLRTSDHGALGQREWLSDIHIANLMFLLVYGQLPLPAEHRDHVQCMYPMNDELFVEILQRAEPGSLLTHSKAGRGVTLVFINPCNNHWRLVVLDGRQRQVTLFDPLGAPLPSMIVEAVRAFVGSSFHVVDLRLCLQAESWNCGIWAVFVASRYMVAAVSRIGHHDDQNSAMVMETHDWLQPGDDFVLLDHAATAAQRLQNNGFAGDLRRQYGAWLAEAAASGRLLYSSSSSDNLEDAPDHTATSIIKATNSRSTVIKAGSAVSASRQRRFFSRSAAELIWIDLTDDMDTVEAEAAVQAELEQSYEDLADNYIEFREDNVNNQDAASLRYSLPAKFQSDMLQQQIAAFREYRRQRFSLFRRGPLVEETTVTNNLRSLLRFLGYLHYEQRTTLQDAPLDMSVFQLPNISALVLSYVEWLEQRRGHKRQAAGDTTFQPVSCSTLANYLNGLINIVKFQLQDQTQLRDPLLEQLRNLRSQAESYATTQKGFEKVHPEWCSWQELQRAREKCRAAFDQREEPQEDRTCLLHLRELVLLCLFTICPPPRCSVVRLLEWDKTLVLAQERGVSDERWMLDLTDPSHAATRHKTHKRKGAMRLPLPTLIHPYLTKLRESTDADSGDALFPSGSTSSTSRATARSSRTCLGPGSFTSFVKATFAKYLDGGQAPNPTLLRSIFTTWLYGLRYDTEDVFLQQIKESSAQWKAHSEQIAATVYNKQLIYQHKAFAQLLVFCETYSARFSYDGLPPVEQDEGDAASEVRGVDGRRSSPRKRRISAAASEDNDDEYVVEELVRVRVDSGGNKQVSVRWEGYRKCTWEPYERIRRQLPEMLRLLEGSPLDDDNAVGRLGREHDDAGVHSFLTSYVTAHGISGSYRWTTDRLAAFEHAVSLQSPPLRVTTQRLRQMLMASLS
jgi:hypothetical protein